MSGYQIKTYQQAVDIFNTCRSPSRGKPLGCFRLYKRGADTILLYFKGYRIDKQHPLAQDLIGHFSPDNTFTFTQNNSWVECNSGSLMQSLHKILPLNILSKDRVLNTYSLGSHEPKKVI